MSTQRSIKKLMFNDDVYSKRGRPVKSLIVQVIDNKKLSVDEICTLALRKKLGRLT